MTIMCGAGNLTHIISPACLSLLLPLSLLMTIMCGAGNLTHIISPASLPFLLSLSLLMTIMCGAGNLTHIISPAYLPLLLSLSLLMTIMCGAVKLTHIISPACSPLLLVTLLFSLYFDDHWMVIDIATTVGMLPLGSTASRYPHITLLQEGIHGCRNFLHLAIGILYMLSYRTVGIQIDGNCCPYLLSPTAPAPRTRCIGDSVARFARPFESRLADTVRRELFRQLASRPGPSTTSGWVAPTATLQATPRPLERATERSFPQVRELKARRRLQF